jgi:hypothetical protein
MVLSKAIVGSRRELRNNFIRPNTIIFFISIFYKKEKLKDENSNQCKNRLLVDQKDLKDIVL